MAKTKSSYNPLKSGSDPRTEPKKGGSWLNIKPNTSVDITSLVEVDDILSCEQCAIWLEGGNSPVWVYTGPEDPSHELGVEKRYRAFLPVLNEDGEVQVWAMGKGAHSNILDIADATGKLKGLDIRIKRTGSGLATRYSIVAKGSRSKVSHIEEPDVISMLGPLTPEEARKLIVEKLEMEDYEEVLDRYRGRAGKAAPKGRKPSAEVAPVRGKHVKEEEEEIEDIEDEEEDDDVELI